MKGLLFGGFRTLKVPNPGSYYLNTALAQMRVYLCVRLSTVDWSSRSDYLFAGRTHIVGEKSPRRTLNDAKMSTRRVEYIRIRR